MATISFNRDIGTPSKGFNLKIDVTYSQDIATNKTTITSVQGYVKRNNSSYYPYNSTSSAVFSIKETSGSHLYSITKNPKYDLDSNGYKKVLNINPNAEISHSADGKKTIVITFSFDGKLSSYYPNGSISKTIELPTIPRTSSVTCADGNIGSATTININRASSTFTHTLTYSFQGLTGTIATKTANTSIGWTIPTSFYTKIPNANSGKGTITCSTYSGNTLIGTSTCTFNAFVVNSNPTISGTVEDTNTSAIQATGNKNKLIRYISNAKVVIMATAKNSATISSVKVVNGSQTKTTSTSTINSVDSGTFNLSCIDSRGLSASATVTKTLVEYIKPVITGVILNRPSTTSNIINASVQGLCFNGNFGIGNNTFELKWRYKKSTETTWSSYTTVTATRTGNNFNFSGELGTDFSYTEAFNFEFVLSDYFMSNTYSTTVTRGLPIIDIGENDVNINGDILCRGQKIPLIYKYTANLSTLDQNTYYPVVGYGLPKGGMSHLRLAVELNSRTKPSWSTHSEGFSCNLDLLNEPAGWGATNGQGIILENNFKFTNTMPVSYQQLENSSRPVFWCRGGGQYYIWTDYDETWTIYTSSVTFKGQTVTPQSTLPNLQLISYSTIQANIQSPEVINVIRPGAEAVCGVGTSWANRMYMFANSSGRGIYDKAFGLVFSVSSNSDMGKTFQGIANRAYNDEDGNKIKHTVAYSNASGTSGTVTLLASAANYKNIRISYKNDDGQYGSTTFSGVSNANCTTYGTIVRKNSSDSWIMLNSALFVVNSTTITISRNTQANIKFGSANTTDPNKLYITKVEVWS